MICLRMNETAFAATDGQDRFQNSQGLKMNTQPNPDPSNQRRRVLLVDPHILMRNAAASWINNCDDLEVCGMTGGMTPAFRAIKRLRPDVVVSEIMQLPDLGFIRKLHRRHPRLPILVFTIQDEVVYGEQARAAGADGFLTKDATGGELVQRICEVMQKRRERPAATPGRTPAKAGALQCAGAALRE
jgi:DNA-binding NarL/FixJ family response regulator